MLHCILLFYKFAWQKVAQPRSKGFSFSNLKGKSPGNEVAMDKLTPKFLFIQDYNTALGIIIIPNLL